MNLTISGRHMEVTEALKDHIRESLHKVTAHFDRVIDANVVLYCEKRQHVAEVNLHANGLRIHSKEGSDDMYVSVDTVMDKVERQVRKWKDRIHRHQPRKAEMMPAYTHAVVAPQEGGNGKQEAPAEDKQHAVVHHEKLTMRPLTLDEAVMQFQLIEEPFLVFSNADTSQVNVLYGRGDGTYGLIEPLY